MLRFLSFSAILMTCWLVIENASAQTTINFDRYADGNPIPDGTNLTNEFLFSHGVRFPNGLRIIRCALNSSRDNECDDALSAPNVVTTHPAPLGDFDRQNLEIEFTTPQRVVSIAVNGHAQAGLSLQFIVSLSAFTSENRLVGERIVSFTSSSTWDAFLRIESQSENISRVVIGGWHNHPARDYVNWLLFDELTFEGVLDPPLDTTPPVVSIQSPANGASITTEQVTVTIRATDNVQLQTVDMQLLHVPTGTIVWDFTGGNICGGLYGSGPCPATFVESSSPSLQVGREGEYQITARATDAAGNHAAEVRSNFFVNSPPPLPRVSVTGVEFNQAVQWRLIDPISYGFGSLSQKIIPGKELTVRYYLLAQGGTRSNYSAQLIYDIEYADGRQVSKTIAPNTGNTAIFVNADPGVDSARYQLQVQQRAIANQTLNFVIPGAELFDVRFMQLRLWNSPENLSIVQFFGLGSPAWLGLNVIRVRSRETGPAPDTATVQTNIIEYLKRAFPVSEVRVLQWRNWGWGGPYLFADDCESLLFDIWYEFGGDDAPRHFPESGPYWTTVLGVATRLSNCGGMAYVGDPDDDDDRIGGTAITTLVGDIAAQEVAHTMGLIHASNAHGEAVGGDWEPWPYSHGLIGPGTTNFGVIVQQVTPPSPANAGQWQLVVVDPCPTANFSQRTPNCQLPETQAVHDFMSYGQSTAFLGPLVTGFSNWISERTYDRIFNAIRYRRLSPSQAFMDSLQFTSIESSAQSMQVVNRNTAERIEALMIGGIIDEKGSVNLLPIMRKPLPESQVLKSKPGPYAIEIFDDKSNLILRKSFNTDHASTTSRMFRVLVPYPETMKTIQIKDLTGPIHETKASPNTPVVKVLSPNGGEVFEKGIYTIKWEGKDVDGDQLSYLVQYSPDNGQRWQGVGLVKFTDTTEVELHVGELIPGNTAIIRVTASDGFNTSEDQSDGVFTLGVDDGTHIEPAYSGALPSDFRLEQNNPNPFNPNTTIRFSLPEPSRVTLTIYNLRGQLVRSLLAEQDYPAGYHQVQWDSRDEHGLSVASGVYIYTLKAGGFFATRKLVLMR